MSNLMALVAVAVKAISGAPNGTKDLVSAILPYSGLKSLHLKKKFSYILNSKINELLTILTHSVPHQQLLLQAGHLEGVTASFPSNPAHQ